MKQVVSSAIGVAMVVVWTTSAVAYRPFVSTDAAVADAHTLEIELGAITLDRTGRDNTFTVPSLVLNYGVIDRWEVVAEGRLQEGSTTEVTDPALSLKGVLREGILQEREGPSLAMEMALLLPSTVGDERNAGVEVSGILSGRMAPMTLHLNVGGGIDRAGRPFGAWGLIGEIPLDQRIRLVSEINGEEVGRRTPSNSVLAGLIWQPTASNVSLDVAIRRGLTGGASDWEITAGVTFGFTLPGRRPPAPRGTDLTGR